MGRLRSVRTIIDHQRRMDISEDQHVRVPVAPGQHEVRFRMGWVGSPTVIVYVAPGETVPVFCRTATNGIWHAFVTRNRAIDAGTSESIASPLSGGREWAIRTAGITFLLGLFAIVASLAGLALLPLLVLGYALGLFFITLPLPKSWITPSTEHSSAWTPEERS